MQNKTTPETTELDVVPDTDVMEDATEIERNMLYTNIKGTDPDSKDLQTSVSGKVVNPIASPSSNSGLAQAYFLNSHEHSL